MHIQLMEMNSKDNDKRLFRDIHMQVYFLTTCQLLYFTSKVCKLISRVSVNEYCTMNIKQKNKHVYVIFIHFIIYLFEHLYAIFLSLYVIFMNMYVIFIYKYVCYIYFIHAYVIFTIMLHCVLCKHISVYLTLSFCSQTIVHIRSYLYRCSWT